jgi:hypothetical protein
MASNALKLWERWKASGSSIYRIQDFESVVPEAGAALGAGVAAGALAVLSPDVVAGLPSAEGAAFPDSEPDSGAVESVWDA